MDVTTRPYADTADLPLIAALIAAAPPMRRHRHDFPWRLSSPVSPQDTRLWFAPDGTLVGFAAWYRWWATLDFYVRPGSAQHEIEDAIFAWAAQRFCALDAERGKPLPYWAEARQDDDARLALLARHGFTHDDDYGYVMLGQSLTGSLPDAPVPDGFAIRPLAGAGEVPAYVALHRQVFESTSMTGDWRTRTRQMPQYLPALDLVVTAPGGQLAGFCVGWLHTGEQIAQIEPLGVHPDFRREGLAHALLAEILRRFRAHGATQALVETETSRTSAQQTYETAGFRPLYQSVRKGRWFA